MTNKISARQAALMVLHKIFTQDAYANLALNEVLQSNVLSQPDRRLTTELVYGTTKNKALLEYWIKKCVPKYDKLTPWIALNLMLAVYQLHFMEKIPPNAAVNEAVNLAKRYGHKGTVALTNGVLRNLLRNESAFAFPERKNITDYLAIRYSHPQWIVERFLKLFGAEETEELLKYNNQNPPLTIRVNILKTTREELIKTLTSDGVSCKEGKYSPYAIEVQGMPSLHEYPPFKEGLFQVQDESSMLAGIIVDPQPGETIIDACAAPGGKATHIAQLMGDKGNVLAFDVHQHKIKLINENAERLELHSLQAAHLDARALGEQYLESADRALVDAPCSGLGVLRRRPDSRWRKDISDITTLTSLQLEILSSVSKTVKKGGALIYSTCTILPEENELLIEKFLSDNKEFHLEDISGLFPVLPEGCEKSAKQGYVTLYPHKHGIDGFFISKISRR